MKLLFEMSTRSSDSDWEDITSGSEESITPDEEEERGQEGIGVHEGAVGFYGGNELQPYQDEPEADEEWIARYEQELAEELARNMEMEERLDGRREISTWSVNQYFLCLFLKMFSRLGLAAKQHNVLGHTEAPLSRPGSVLLSLLTCFSCDPSL